LKVTKENNKQRKKERKKREGSQEKTNDGRKWDKQLKKTIRNNSEAFARILLSTFVSGISDVTVFCD
jgi:hypothetical protein